MPDNPKSGEQENCGDELAIARLVQFGLDSAPKPEPEVVISPANESEFIGRYRLIEKIGEGGMGVVWRAQQLEDVKREVALKVIRAGVGDKTTISRFEGERQAIAMMDHPNIARILDAGSTEDGRPYFVMELVGGVPLAEYCEQKQLRVADRLKLMIPVCRAIQHAHQKGIIHRDLKHSNVIVMESDGKAIPKVIDFGLAKALEHRMRLTDETVYTEAGRVVGTVYYMSPEQASETPVDIDTRSDIYSLGVMVYKLLTGDTPLDRETAESISFIEALAIIRDRDPILPSQVLRKQSDTHSVIKDGSMERDLDWIVMKALEKDRRDRYETVDAFALDLQRYLNDEVVSARPTTGLYAVRKFIRRNRGLVATLSTITLLLLSGIIATTMTARWAMTERDNAQETTRIREVELYSMRLNSAYSDWKLGLCESAWQKMGLLSDCSGWEIDFLRSEFSSGEKVLFGHHCWINSIDVSPDGKWIATGAQDYTVKVWSVKTQQLAHSFLFDDQVSDVCFSPDSKLIAATCRDNEIKICSVAPFAKSKTFGPYKEDPSTVAFSTDGKFLIAGSDHIDSEIATSGRDVTESLVPKLRSIRVDDGRIVHEVEEHSMKISSVCCGPGNVIATGSEDHEVCVWELSDRGQLELKHTLSNHYAGVTSVAFSPSGELLASSSLDNSVLLWDVESFSVVRAISGHDEAVNNVRFDSTGERIVTASSDGTARVWGIDGSEIRTCQGHFDPVKDAAFIPGSESIATASLDTTARIWATDRSTNTVSGEIFDDTVWSADFSPDGNLVAACGDDNSLRFSDPKTGAMLGKPIKHDESILTLSFSPDGKHVAYAGMEGIIRILDVESRNIVAELEQHKDYIWSIDYSPDGTRLISGSADNTVIVWDTTNWSVFEKLNGHNGEVTGVRYSHDGKQIVTAGHDKIVRLWNAETLKLVHEFTGHKNTIWRAIFSHDDSRLASCSSGGKIIVWDIAKRKRIQDLDGHQNEVAGIAFTPAGDRLISASDDRTIRVWHIETGTELMVLPDPAGTQAVHLSFSPNGKEIVVGSTGGMVTVFGASRAAGDPVLPQTTEANSIQGFLVLKDRSSSRDQVADVLKIARQGCNHFPGHETYRNVGMAQYRLGNYDEAITALKESLRLEPVQYGEILFHPYIEGFLAMAYRKSGDFEAAQEIRKSFQLKLTEEGLDESPETEKLRIEVGEILGQ